MGGVTNNTTRVWIGYRIYSLWRLELQQVTQLQWTLNTRSFTNPADGTALHWRLTSRTALVWLRRLTDALIPETQLTHSGSRDWLTKTKTRALCCLLYITLGRPDRKPGLPTVGCQATNTGLPTVGYHRTNNTRVASVSMEISTTVA
jgi:hypothetical protein